MHTLINECSLPKKKYLAYNNDDIRKKNHFNRKKRRIKIYLCGSSKC